MAPPLRRRMACWVYEGMLLFGVVFVAGLLFSVSAQMRSGIDPRRPLLAAFCFIVFAVYFAYCWSRGQTLAMRTWRIRVVTRDAQPLSELRALLRYVVSWIWFAPPVAAFVAFGLRPAEYVVLALGWVAIWAVLSRFHPERQFWHDAWVGTRLVSAPR